MLRIQADYADHLQSGDWLAHATVKATQVGAKLSETGAVQGLNVKVVGKGQLRITASVRKPRAKRGEEVLIFLSRSPRGDVLIAPKCSCRERRPPCGHVIAVMHDFVSLCDEEMSTRPGRRNARNRGAGTRKSRSRIGAKYPAMAERYLACEIVPSEETGLVELGVLLPKRPVIDGSDYRRCTVEDLSDPRWWAALSQGWMRQLMERLQSLVPRSAKGDEIARIRPDGKEWTLLLVELMKWRILYWGGGPNPVLMHEDGPRPAKPVWHFDQTREDFLTDWEFAEPVAAVIPSEPLHYIDARRRLIGEVETAIPSEVAVQWLGEGRRPGRKQVKKWNARLQARNVPVAFPLPPEREVIDGHAETPLVCLHLSQRELPRSTMRAVWSPVFHELPVVEICFCYGDGEHAVPESGPGFAMEAEHCQVLRNETAERVALDRLDQLGIRSFAATLPSEVDSGPWSRFRWVGVWSAEESRAAWMKLMTEVMPALERDGWRVVYAENFEMRFVQPTNWIQSLREKRQRSWFEFELGIECEGQRIDLIPVLIAYLKHHADIERQIETLKPEDRLPIPLADGRYLAFPVARLQPIIRILKDILDHQRARWREDEGYALHPLVAADFLLASSVHTDAGESMARLEAVGRRLREEGEGDAERRELPRGLQATLRSYQEEGFQWLQSLCRFGIGGILADDMGLGKTLQTIAHLLAEKQNGRLRRPALVVTPTSLLGNWQDELAKFAPDLSVFLFYGAQRHADGQALDAADVILTSYTLVHRDQGFLETRSFSHLILDEAQKIKNPASQSARAACALDAEHRLCLTGTPMENHLEELWSLFHFLMPGFLGRPESFRQRFRYPIERDQDETATALLAKRVAPVILRRRKTEVARELPPKTEILQTVELEGSQRDLYETIRASMEERVQEVIAEQGLERVHLYILDALLKLRQVCCDPRLLDLDAARSVSQSAKMEMLFEWLPTMIEEGRRILLFSQFTSMLALIEERLKAEDIPYLKLTGRTRKRAEVVRSFQEGEVPLFLISLKAGGVGLNLTRADTVIHYDPWWNPAVEDQATDRAHRIGQEHPVFVYKLITRGSIEERIVAMQEGKKELVEGLLSTGSKKSLQWSKADLDRLFRPLAD